MRKVLFAVFAVLVVALSIGCKNTNETSSSRLFNADPDITWIAVQNAYKELTGHVPASIDNKNHKFETGQVEVYSSVDRGDSKSQRISKIYSGVIYIKAFTNGNRTDTWVTIEAVTKPKRTIKTSTVDSSNNSAYSSTITSESDTDLCNQFMTAVSVELTKLKSEAKFDRK